MAINPSVSVRLLLETKDAEARIKSIEQSLNSLGKNKNKLQVDISNAEEAKKELHQVFNELEKLTSKRHDISIKADQLKQYKQQILEIDKTINDLKEKILSLQDKQALGKISDSELAKLKEYQRTLKDLNLKKSNINIAIREQGLSKANKELNAIDKKIEKLKNRKAEIEATIKNGYKAKRELKEIERETKELKNNRAEIEMSIKDYEQTMSKLNNIQRKIDSIGKMKSSLGNFANSLNDMGNKLLGQGGFLNNTALGKLSHFLVQGTLYSGMYRGVSGLMNMFEDTVGQAVTRYDTLTASENTWSNMGFSGAQINKANDQLQDIVDGLPTTLDDAIKQTTKISAVTKDLNKAVDVYSAINNGVLAFGGSSEEAQRAINQFSQTIGKGVIDAQTYNALLNDGMAPALTEVAQMFGYTSNEMGKFKDALGARGDSDGKHITANEFMDALVQLNKDGSSTMKSLSSIAKETANVSIGMAFTNLKTRMAKGMTETFKAMNEVIEDGTGKTIPDTLRSIGDWFAQAGKNFAKTIREHKAEIQDFINYLGKLGNKAKDFISQFDFKSFFDGVSSSLKPVLGVLKGAYNVLAPMVKNLLSFVGGGDISKGLGRLFGGKYALGLGLKALALQVNGFTKVLTVGEVALKGYYLSMNKLLGRKYDVNGGFFSKKLESMANLKQQFKSSGKPDDMIGATSQLFNSNQFKINMAGHANRAAYIAEIGLIAADMILIAKALKELDKAIPDDILSIVPKITAMGAIMGAMSLAVNQLGKMSKSNGWENQLAGTASLFMSGGALWLMAKGMQEFSKIDIRWGKFFKNLAQMGVAIGAITAVQTGLGLLMSAKGGILMLFQEFGALSQTLASGSLMAMAKAMNDLSKVNIDNPDDIKEKIQVMTDILNSLQDLQVGVIGSWFQKKEYQNITKAIESIANVTKSLKTISKAKIDKGVVAKTKQMFNVAKEIVESIPSKGWIQQLGEAIDNWGRNKDIQSLTKVITQLGNMVNSMNTLNTMKKFDKKKITENIQVMADIAGEIGNILNESGITGLGKDKKGSHVADMPETFKQLQKITDSLAKMKKSFDELNKLDSATYNWSNLKKVISKSVEVLGDVKELLVDESGESNFKGLNQKVSGRLNNLKSAITAIKDSITTMNDLRTYIDTNMQGVDMANVEKQFSDVTNMMGRLGKLFTENETYEKDGKTVDTGKNVFTGLNIDVKRRMSNLKMAIASIKDMMTSIQELRTFMANDMGGVDLAEVEEQFTKATNMMASIGKLFTQTEKDKDGNDTGKTAFTGLNQDVRKRMNNLKTAITAIKDSMTAVQEVKTIIDSMGDVDLDKVSQQIQNVVGMFGQIAVQLKSDDFKGLNGKIQERFTTMKEVVNTLKEVFNMLNELNATVVGMGDTFNFDGVDTALTSLQTLMEKMTSNEKGSFMEAVNKLVKVKEKMATVREMLNGENGFVTLINSLMTLSNSVGDFSAINTMIDNAQTAINKIASMSIDGDTTFSAEINQLVEDFKAMVNELSTLSTEFETAGTDWATSLKTGWNSVDVKGAINKTMESILKAMDKKKQELVNKGREIGEGFSVALSEAISAGLNGLNNVVSNQILNVDYAGLGSSAGTKFSDSFNANVNLNTNPNNKQATGGGLLSRLFGDGYATGGVVTGPSGIDRVQARLTAGEFVIKKDVVDTLGIPFLNKLNGLNLTGAYNQLSTSVGTQHMGTMNVTTINNNYNTTSNSINIKETHNRREQQVRANRFLRGL